VRYRLISLATLAAVKPAEQLEAAPRRMRRLACYHRQAAAMGIASG
jgi:hypothetical protein